MKLSEKYIMFAKTPDGMFKIDDDFAKDSLSYGDCFVVIYAQQNDNPIKQQVEALFDNYNEACDFANAISSNPNFVIGFIDHQMSESDTPINNLNKNLFYAYAWDLLKRREKISDIEKTSNK